jgi:hypothetical protein
MSFIRLRNVAGACEDSRTDDFYRRGKQSYKAPDAKYQHFDGNLNAPAETLAISEGRILDLCDRGRDGNRGKSFDGRTTVASIATGKNDNQNKRRKEAGI